MVRWSLVLASIAACYQPSVHEGAPCGPGATCPTDQECRAGTCFFTSTPGDSSVGWDGSDYDAPPEITTDAAPDAPPYVAWAAPVVIPSLELAQSNEDDPSITNDRLTVVIAADETVAPINTNLFIGTRATTADPFTVTALTALNSPTANDKSPEISPDGSTIYFTSNRATNNDVYMSTQTGGVWAAPTLVTELSPHNEGDMAVSPDGLTAITVDDQTQHHFWLYSRASTAASWGTGISQTALEITTDIAAPSITNGAATIYFHAGATRDLYVSYRVNGTFTTPQPVTELNTTGRDAAPFVLQSDRYMIFDRNYDIYETTR